MNRKNTHKEASDFDAASDQIEQELRRTHIPEKASRGSEMIFKIALFAVICMAILCVSHFVFSYVGIETIICMIAVTLLIIPSTHIVLSWEKIVVLRFGKLNRVVGPGLFFTMPIIEYGAIRVDQRIMTTPFTAEKTLTLDLVPINIDAVLYWMVWDAEKACTEVEDYFAAVSFLAQTAMRETIGRSTVAEVAIRRDQLDVEIKSAIEHMAASWGIDIISVKVRDIVLPDELQEVMSLEAQAERERNARMTLVSIENDVAEVLADAAKLYSDPDAAMKLRTMLTLYETVKKSKGAVITIPSSISDNMGEGSIDKIIDSLKS